MSKSVVLDTCVFIYYLSDDPEHFSDCWYIIDQICYERSLRVAVDDDGEIHDEYMKHINQFINFGNKRAKILMDVLFSGYFSYDNIKFHFIIPLKKDKMKGLIDQGFDKDDLKFIGIAPRTDTRIIVTTDTRSLLNSIYQVWIKNNLGVESMNPHDFREYSKKAHIQSILSSQSNIK